MRARNRVIGGAVGLLLILACSPKEVPPPVEESASEVTSEALSDSSGDLFWERLQALCGKAFEGRLVSDDEVDADFAEQVMRMHVRSCEPEEIRIPFHVGEDRSRTWVLRRSEAGLRLQHDHRHEDGSEDEVTLYGGWASETGSESRQDFPVDEETRQLFLEQGLEVSVANTWSLEVLPDERFSYVMSRPGRLFRVDFDLTREIEPPPAPWGSE